MAYKKEGFSGCTDEELMRFLREGETLAFDELYKRYAPRLFAYFFRMLNFNRAHAEDALQELFLRIAEAPDKFDLQRPFKTWVFSIASNSCKNFYRHQQVVHTHRQQLDLEKEVDENTFLALAGTMDGKLFRQMLEKVLLELPPEKKEVFLLRYQEDKTISEIATIQQCAEGSVKSRLHYTLKILEEKLKMFNPVIQKQ